MSITSGARSGQGGIGPASLIVIGFMAIMSGVTSINELLARRQQQLVGRK